MAEFVEGLHAHLVADAGVTAAVGTRIYPITPPQGPTMPYVVYDQTAGEPGSALGADIGLVWATINFDAFAATYLEALQVQTAIRSDIKRQGWTQAGVTCVDAILMDTESDYEDEVSAYVASVEYEFIYRE